MSSQDFSNKMDPGIINFNQPKVEGDIDLVKEVRDCMIASGLQAKLPLFDGNRFIIDAQGKNSDVQRYFLNRYWAFQLMSSNKPAVDERYCLIPNGDVRDWLALFKSKIMPFVLENNLPVN